MQKMGDAKRADGPLNPLVHLFLFALCNLVLRKMFQLDRMSQFNSRNAQTPAAVSVHPSLSQRRLHAWKAVVSHDALGHDDRRRLLCG